MDEASETIFQSTIRQVLKAEAGESVSASNEAPDASKVPETFDFEQAAPEFKRKVFKQTLEEIIGKFEGTKDLLSLPVDSVIDINDGLNNTNSGFYTLLEDSSITDAVKKELNAVLPILMEAQAYVLESTTLLDEQKGKRHDYYLALLNCRHQMSQIKKLLKVWKIEKGAK